MKSDSETKTDHITEELDETRMLVAAYSPPSEPVEMWQQLDYDRPGKFYAWPYTYLRDQRLSTRWRQHPTCSQVD